MCHYSINHFRLLLCRGRGELESGETLSPNLSPKISKGIQSLPHFQRNCLGRKEHSDFLLYLSEYPQLLNFIPNSSCLKAVDMDWGGRWEPTSIVLLDLSSTTSWRISTTARK